MHYITVTESKTWLPLNHQTKRESLSSSHKDWERWIRKTKVILFYFIFCRIHYLLLHYHYVGM